MTILLLLLGLLVGSVGLVEAQSSCKRPVANLQGVSGADIVVSSTPIIVMENNPSRCFAVIKNNSANQVRCMASFQGVPTATAGILLSQNDWLQMESESGNAWRCVRVTSDAAIQVLETIP